MLDRYRRKNGFIQLLQLLETSTVVKRDKFLSLIQEEDDLWSDALLDKMLSLDHLLEWEIPYRAEVFSRLPAASLAALSTIVGPDQKEKIFSCIPMGTRKSIQDLLIEVTYSANDGVSALHKVLIETRALVEQGVLKFDKFAPALHIPEDIEDQLLRKRQEKNKSAAPSFTEADFKSLMKTATPESKETSSATGDSEKIKALQNEVDSYRTKMQALAQELVALRQENQLMKQKLDQIRKII